MLLNFFGVYLPTRDGEANLGAFSLFSFVLSRFTAELQRPLSLSYGEEQHWGPIGKLNKH
jgi:hypothetical protein